MAGVSEVPSSGLAPSASECPGAQDLLSAPTTSQNGMIGKSDRGWGEGPQPRQERAVPRPIRCGMAGRSERS
jgi:hypothetical protein